MDQRKQELAYYKALKQAQEREIRVLRAANKQLERIIKALESIPDEEAKKEPRFLLDKDSPCYGCPEYKNIKDCALEDPWEHWGEGDKNGGVCDTEKPCFSGSGNTYKGGATC
jgi:hypothetical protein